MFELRKSIHFLFYLSFKNFLFLLLAFSCRPVDINNLCDPNNGTFKNLFFLSNILEEEIEYCGNRFFGKEICELTPMQVIQPKRWSTLQKYIQSENAKGNSALPINTITPSGLSGTAKWLGGVLVQSGKLISVPFIQDFILIFDPISGTKETISTPITGINKWEGGVLGPNGKVYMIPRDANSILVFDPESKAISQISSPLTGSNKWRGGVLAPNGKIYGIPNEASSVLVIDPIIDSASLLSYESAELNQWEGGVLGPNGKIYAIPVNSNRILVIDPFSNSTSFLDSPEIGTSKWRLGVLAPTGTIIGIPHSSDNFLEIDPFTNDVRLNPSPILAVAGKWRGGALSPDGKIYLSPADNASLYAYNPMTKQSTLVETGLVGPNKWGGGKMLKNGQFITIPHTDDNFLSIQTNANGNYCDSVLMSGYFN